jgi:hypothetical protein
VCQLGQGNRFRFGSLSHRRYHPVYDDLIVFTVNRLRLFRKGNQISGFLDGNEIHITKFHAGSPSFLSLPALWRGFCGAYKRPYLFCQTGNQMGQSRNALPGKYRLRRVKRRAHGSYVSHKGDGIKPAADEIARQNTNLRGFDSAIHRLNKRRPSLGLNDPQGALS